MAKKHNDLMKEMAQLGKEANKIRLSVYIKNLHVTESKGMTPLEKKYIAGLVEKVKAELDSHNRKPVVDSLLEEIGLGLDLL